MLGELTFIIIYFLQYLSELTLMDGTFLQYRPSEIGSAAVAIARHTCGAADAWPTVLAELTKYEAGSFQPCVSALQDLFGRASGMQQQAIREKYSTKDYCFVGRKEPL